MGGRLLGWAVVVAAVAVPVAILSSRESVLDVTVRIVLLREPDEIVEP